MERPVPDGPFHLLSQFNFPSFSAIIQKVWTCPKRREIHGEKKLVGALLLLTLAFAFISCEFGPSENQRSLLIGTWEATAGNNTKVEMAVTESTIKFRIDGEVSKEHPYTDNMSDNFAVSITITDPDVASDYPNKTIPAYFVISNDSFTTSSFSSLTFLSNKVGGPYTYLTFTKTSDTSSF